VISRREDLVAFLEAHPLHHLYGGENAYLLNEYIEAVENAGIHLTCVLNPFQSDINLFPETVESFKARLAKKLRFPKPQWIPLFVLT
jgi:hypothetical protein